MAAPGVVFTIARAAEMLGETVDLLDEIADQLEPEDGCLWIYDTDEHAKRDYARVKARPDAISVLQQLPAWFEDYNTIHPHSGLRMRSPREFIAQQSANQAACPV